LVISLSQFFKFFSLSSWEWCQLCGVDTHVSVPHRSRRSGAHAKAPTEVVRAIDQQALGAGLSRDGHQVMRAEGIVFV
jgi:hypothetical protein